MFWRNLEDFYIPAGTFTLANIVRTANELLNKALEVLWGRNNWHIDISAENDLGKVLKMAGH